MDRDTRDEGEEEKLVELKFARRSAGHKKPAPKKASYERNADVQRWLKEQTVEEGGVKPEFNPTFVASLRDAPWILSSLTQFYEQDLISDVLHVVRSGKEATVYCCAADRRTGAEYLAAKVYRPRMFRSLKNDVVYRQSRVTYNVDGRIARGKQRNPAKKEDERERASRVTSWIKYEYETQRRLYQAGCDIPQPFWQTGNAVLMEYVGSVDEAAPLLREVVLERDEAPALFECIMRNIELFLAHDVVHGDLSEYNILYWEGDVTIIDFAQAVDPRYNPAVFELLMRDIARVCRHFARYGVEADPFELATDLWERYCGAVL